MLKPSGCHQIDPAHCSLLSGFMKFLPSSPGCLLYNVMCHRCQNGPNDMCLSSHRQGKKILGHYTLKFRLQRTEGGAYCTTPWPRIWASQPPNYILRSRVDKSRAWTKVVRGCGDVDRFRSMQSTLQPESIATIGWDMRRITRLASRTPAESKLSASSRGRSRTGPEL